MTIKYGLITALVSSIILTASTWTSSEESLLGNYSEMIFRPDSLTLCIVTAEGDTLVFADNPFAENSDVFNVYRESAYFPHQNYWVIYVVEYEWEEWLLVNGVNGRIDTTISEPMPSPDGSRFLCAHKDLEAGFSENGIQIWRIDTDSLVLEFSDLHLFWGPRQWNWLGDSVIVFEKTFYDWRSHSPKILPGRLELSSDGVWIPEDPESWE